MIRLLNTLFPKSLVVAAAGAGMFVAAIGDASACDGRRGGIVRALYGSAYGSQYVQRPVQPYCPQQQFQQPLGQQQFSQQQFPQQQMVPPQVQQLIPQGQQQVQIQGQQQQFVQGQQVVQQGQQVVQGQQVAQQGQQFQQGGVAQQGIAQQGVAQQQVQSNTVVTQNNNVAAPIGGASTAQAGTAQSSVSAIGALGGSSPAATGVQNQAVVPTQTVAAPSQNLAAGAQPNAAAPATGNAAQAPAAPAEQSATESALQALMGDTIPGQSAAAQPVTAAPASAPIGEFSATLTNGTTIRLSLRADGSFAWVATKGDKVSTFQGTFSFGGTSLTLNRTSDSQKLEGALALTANGFKLQFSGQNAEGLNFVRA